MQNVFPSLPQQFMHPSIHHDHAVKRMLYPKPKVLMMFRPLLQSFTCLPPFSVEEAEERGKPTSPFRTVDALKKKPTAPTPDTRLSDSCICAANGWHRQVRNCAWPCARNTMPAAVVKDGTVTPKFRQGKISPPFLTAKFSPRNSPLAKFSPPPVDGRRRSSEVVRLCSCVDGCRGMSSIVEGCESSRGVTAVDSPGVVPVLLTGVRGCEESWEVGQRLKGQRLLHQEPRWRTQTAETKTARQTIGRLGKWKPRTPNIPKPNA